LQEAGAKKKVTKKKRRVEYFALCGERGGLRARPPRKLFEKSLAKTSEHGQICANFIVNNLTVDF